MQSKSTGQLSVTVYIANAVGCVARIFTSLQEGGGYAMVRGFLLGNAPYPLLLRAACYFKDLVHCVSSQGVLSAGPSESCFMQVWSSMEPWCISVSLTAERRHSARRL